MFVPTPPSRYNIPDPKPGTVRKFICWGEWDYYFDLLPGTVREMTAQEVKKANRFWRKKKPFISNGNEYWWIAERLEPAQKKKLGLLTSNMINKVVKADLVRVQHDI